MSQASAQLSGSRVVEQGAQALPAILVVDHGRLTAFCFFHSSWVMPIGQPVSTSRAG